MEGPFRGTEVVGRGLVTWGQLRGPRYRRLFPDVYVPAELELDLGVRSRAAYLLVRDRGGALAGYSAARLLGAGCAPRDASAEVVVPANARRHPGVRMRRFVVAEPDIVLVDGCRVTSAARTAWDLAQRLSLVEAVVAVDALARAGGFRPDHLLARAAAGPGARGCRRVSEIVALSDPRAESPPETRLRVALVRGGLPPVVQYVINDEYGFPLARADLAYPDAKLAVEYDGVDHLERRREERDRYRDARLATYGWDTVRLTAADLGTSTIQTVRRVAELLTLRCPDRYARLEVDAEAVLVSLEPL